MNGKNIKCFARSGVILPEGFTAGFESGNMQNQSLNRKGQILEKNGIQMNMYLFQFPFL